MIEIPPITGKIRPVPLTSYKEIIENYVDKAGKLEQVSSIIQMGSFTKPGISDIDLIVVIKDGMPFPDWNEISLRSLSKSHIDSEVIAHDIFVIPESIAKNSEAYFYIDHQNVLKGRTLGGNIQKEIGNKCKEFLALEYAIFSLDSIAGMLLSPSVNLRNITLLISGMRHSAALACNLKIINEKQKNEYFNQIEKFRSGVLSSDFSLEDLSYLFAEYINLLHSTIREISESLTKEINDVRLKKSWMINSKTGMIGIENVVDYLEPFMDVINKQKSSLLSKYTRIFTVPIKSQIHIGAYLDGNEKAAVYFRNHFSMMRSFHDRNELNTKARELRGEVVRQHWEFINKTGYLKSSGRAYCGLSFPNKSKYKSVLRKTFLYYQLQKYNRFN